MALQESEKIDFAAARNSDTSNANLIPNSARQGRNRADSSFRSLEISPSRDLPPPPSKPRHQRRHTAGYERTLPLERYPSAPQARAANEARYKSTPYKSREKHDQGSRKRELTFKGRVRHFTWTWFTMSMATGGVANVLYTSVSLQFILTFYGVYAYENGRRGLTNRFQFLNRTGFQVYLPLVAYSFSLTLRSFFSTLA